MTPQGTEADLPMSVQESLAEAWVTVACRRVGALTLLGADSNSPECAGTSLFEGSSPLLPLPLP